MLAERHLPNDALVVLGCRVEASGALSATLERRAEWGRVAFQAGLARYVIPSGGRRWGDHIEANQVRSYLAARDVPESAIFPELCSLTTSENAVFTRAVMRRLGVRRALVVTCGWHMARAIECFRLLGVEAVPMPVPASPAPPFARLYRSVHEIVATRLDRRYLAKVCSAQPGAHPFADPEPGP